MKVGFIGLGRMGQGIAGNVLRGGHDLVVFNRTAAKADALVADGASLAGSIADVCAGVEVVISMLAHDGALLDVLHADGGLLQSLPDGAIHMAMGTHSVAVTGDVATAHEAAGKLFVACPVLGRPDVAAAGQLGLVPGGRGDLVDRCRPLLDAIGRRTFEAGENPSSAASIKVTNNFVLGCAIEAMAEAFSLTRKYGVDPAVFYDVLADGMFNCTAYKVYGDIIAKEDYDRVGITAILGLKDANLALQAGEAVGVPLPSGNAWRDRLVGAIAHGDGDKDWAVVGREQARASGIE
jgi:3-hydroxyisobutyrate dehydrogenase-like beta-hydroxyacid dehydrogenase